MKSRYWLFYIAIAALQVLLGNFLNLGQYVTLCLLPLLIVSLPLGYSAILSMAIAFATAMATDFLTHGILGLSAVALLPVAFMRRWIAGAVFGGETLSRGDEISRQKQGTLKMSLAILIATAVYFAVFVWVDAAGTRSFGFNLIRWLASTVASTIVEIPLSGLISSEEEGRWK